MALTLPFTFNTATAAGALSPFFSDSGNISLSVDAIGTDGSAQPLKVHKNAAGATVRKAFLFAATTPFGGTPVDGDVTLDGSPVSWDSSHTITNDFGVVNVLSDVTSLVKPKVDAAGTGDVAFAAAEPNGAPIDGEILAVTLNDPTVTNSGSVTLLYGAQSTAGDTFPVTLASPVDKTNPNFALDLSLGISFGYQPAGQFSTVDVNGSRLTSSAGGQDDCDQKYAATPDFAFSCGDGQLITAGGIGDSNDNPPAPNANDSTCSGAAGPAPRCDDELYNLLPFVDNGDTNLTFTTTNPSDDDNIFFGALRVGSGAAVVGKGVVLSPVSATNPVGQQHALTATVQDDNGDPVPGVTVHFAVTSGPNAGVNGDDVTDASGEANFSYTSSTTGTDHIVASFTDNEGTHTSNEVTKTWGSASAPGKISARGTVEAFGGTTLAFSAANNCNLSLSTRPSIVGTTAGGRIWTKSSVTESQCTDQPPASPLGFDTQTGTATGTFGPAAPGGLNGQQGTLQWNYHDGSPDTVEFDLLVPPGDVVFHATQQTPGAYSGAPGGVWTFGP